MYVIDDQLEAKHSAQLDDSNYLGLNKKCLDNQDFGYK